ncbi:MAG: hypothetical protein A2V93_00080 [Ignavibacteria bacterium RBG_16_34_14]|nr:MAG: hypothetical protein A2V93_00080 [Ignavibacteria bacterium RBG_16_34_14]
MPKIKRGIDDRSAKAIISFLRIERKGNILFRLNLITLKTANKKIYNLICWLKYKQNFFE